MELRHLRYFVAVAEELSFTRAAERLHIGQPPLSQQIQALEAEVGAQLLERSKRWVRLTEAGKLFLDDARRVLALSEQAKLTARRAQRGEAGELRIGFTFSTPFTPLFATVINRYRARYPDAQSPGPARGFPAWRSAAAWPVRAGSAARPGSVRGSG